MLHAGASTTALGSPPEFLSEVNAPGRTDAIVYKTKLMASRYEIQYTLQTPIILYEFTAELLFAQFCLSVWI